MDKNETWEEEQVKKLKKDKKTALQNADTSRHKKEIREGFKKKRRALKRSSKQVINLHIEDEISIYFNNKKT